MIEKEKERKKMKMKIKRSSHLLLDLSEI